MAGTSFDAFSSTPTCIRIHGPSSSVEFGAQPGAYLHAVVEKEVLPDVVPLQLRTGSIILRRLRSLLDGADLDCRPLRHLLILTARAFI